MRPYEYPLRPAQPLPIVVEPIEPPPTSGIITPCYGRNPLLWLDGDMATVVVGPPASFFTTYVPKLLESKARLPPVVDKPLLFRLFLLLRYVLPQQGAPSAESTESIEPN